MLNAVFQDHRTLGSGDKDFQGFSPYVDISGHLSLVTRILFINLCSLFPKRLHIKLIKRFERKICLKIMVIYMFIAPGKRQTTILGQNVYKNINLLSVWSFVASLTHEMSFATTHTRPNLTLP